jgi:hypothetical protein
MKFWAAVAYTVAALIAVTLPFDPFLNRRPLIIPLSLLCVVVALISIYVCTLPERPKHPRDKGAL